MLSLDNYIAGQSEIAFAPAQVLVAGKTTTDRKLSVVTSEGFTAQAGTFLAGTSGKVGALCRKGLKELGASQIAVQARQGNYLPLAQAISALTGESLTIPNRASFESLNDRYNDKLLDLELTKGRGYTVSVSKKDGSTTVKPSAKRTVLNNVISLITAVQEITKSL